MYKHCIVILSGLIISLFITNSSADQSTTPPKYNESILEKQFLQFMDGLDPTVISTGYPEAIRQLLSANPKEQIRAVKTLAETGKIEVIPWLIPYLDSANTEIRLWSEISLEKIVSSTALERRDQTRLECVIIRPLGEEDTDLRPLAWIVLKMFRAPDNGNTHAKAARMTRYLELYEFEDELRKCLKSTHPAVSDTAEWALESLALQKDYAEANATFAQPDNEGDVTEQTKPQKKRGRPTRHPLQAEFL